MKRRIVLAPLDGTPAAEAALPYAIRLAAAQGLGIELLGVLPPVPANAHGGVDDRPAQALRWKLEYAAERLRGRGCTVETAVRSGDPVEITLIHAEKRRARAVIMTSGTMSGAGQPRGATAEALLPLSPCPILVVGEGRNLPAPGWGPRRLLVPLDGTPAAEAALPLAYELALALHLEVVLARVQPWTGLRPALGDRYSVDSARLDGEAARVAAAYVRSVAHAAPAGVAVREVLLRGTPASQLVELAAADGIDLVVVAPPVGDRLLGTPAGSISERLVRAGVPALLIPPAALATSASLTSVTALPA